MRKETLNRYLLGIGIAVGVVALDLFTKRLAAIEFIGGATTIIPGVLSFTYGENPGAAFSMLQGVGSLLGVAAFIAVGVVLWSIRTERPRLELVGLGMIMGGATGNLIDRIARGDELLDGHVIDWIQFPNFPIFNIADSSITVGVALILITSWRQRPTEGTA